LFPNWVERRKGNGAKGSRRNNHNGRKRLPREGVILAWKHDRVGGGPQFDAERVIFRVEGKADER